MLNIKLYVLKNPDTNEIRYVGKTKNPLKKRLYEHLTKRNLKSKTHKNNWLKSLLKDGKKPIIELLDVVSEDLWQEKEIYYIKKYRKLYPNLTNHTDGGEGALGVKRSKESIQKVLDTKLKRYGNFNHSDETKEKISKAHKGKKHTKERTERQAQKLRKTLLQYDLSGNLIKKWFGVRKCSRELNINYTSLRYHIKNGKPINGFIFDY